MRAFVVRPFRPHPNIGLDPDTVDAELISPALALTGYEGGTSKIIADSGSVPERVIREIIDAELVIADITIHNPNVFYEIGMRHSLRPTGTILIRARTIESDTDPLVPFDIEGLSYVSYDRANPAAAVSELTDTIRASRTLESVDSPVYRLFPDLRVDASGWSRLPPGLTDEVEDFSEEPSPGDLRLLAEDVVGTRFESQALRRIAHAQAAVNDDSGARRTWESVLHRDRFDYEANHELATLYARDNNLTRSDQAIERGLRIGTLDAYQRAELHALQARNLKDRWQQEYKRSPQDLHREAALASSALTEALDVYESAFFHSLDNYYAGLNALALVDIQTRLAEALPDVWAATFATTTDAEEGLTTAKRRRTWLLDAVAVSLQRARELQTRSGEHDPWLNSSTADFQFVSGADPIRITMAYRRAASRLGPSAHTSVTRQLRLYKDLGIRDEIVEAALNALGSDVPVQSVNAETQEIVIFAGHVIDPAGSDLPGAEPPRFPETKVDEVKARLTSELDDLKKEAHSHGRQLVGFAGASAGGDLLFHEVCKELLIPREVFLVVPDELFRAVGISRGALTPTWMTRYHNALDDPRKVHVLERSPDLPSWRNAGGGRFLWEPWARWMIHHAKCQGDRVSALALSDGRPQAHPYGVNGFIATAQARGVPVQKIPIFDD
jgi:hypothetical protein